MPEFLRAYGEVLQQENPRVYGVFIAAVAVAGALFAFFALGALVRAVSRALGRTIASPPAPRTEIDPVCGMTVPATSGYRAEFNGAKYLFCGPQCLDKFQDMPEAYERSAADHHVEGLAQGHPSNGGGSSHPPHIRSS